jgi:hypothetical protein
MFHLKQSVARMRSFETKNGRSISSMTRAWESPYAADVEKMPGGIQADCIRLFARAVPIITDEVEGFLAPIRIELGFNGLGGFRRITFAFDALVARESFTFHCGFRCNKLCFQSHKTNLEGEFFGLSRKYSG